MSSAIENVVLVSEGEDAMTKTLEELPSFAVESCREEFKDLSETWRHLDTKAQGVSTISGVFVAAMFAWAKELPAGLNHVDRILVICCVVLLAIAVLNAVMALWVRSLRAPPLGGQVAKLVRDILDSSTSEEGAQRSADVEAMRLSAFYSDQIRLWDAASTELRASIKKKACLIAMAQAALAATVVLFAMVVARLIIATL